MTISYVKDPKYASVSRYRWSLTDLDGTGRALSNPMAADKSVQVTGTFNSGTVTMQGSNQNPAVDWSTLHDPTGVVLTFTTAGIMAIMESPLHIRPIMTGTAGAALVNVDLISKGN